jgi:DNA repair protein RecO
MAHHVYHTEGIILGGSYSGEANKVVRVLTKELGLIVGVAQGARLIRSKLRYSLTDYTHGTFALVRGKNIWRVTNASGYNNLTKLFSGEREKFLMCARVLSLVDRLVQGEDKNQELYDIVALGIDFLSKSPLEIHDILNAERIMVLKVLHSLGYCKHVQGLREFIEKPLTGERMSAMQHVKKEAVKEINDAIRESQL